MVCLLIVCELAMAHLIAIFRRACVEVLQQDLPRGMHIPASAQGSQSANKPANVPEQEELC